MTLLHRRGYFDQRLAAQGHQSEAPVTWLVERLLEPLEPRVEVEIEGRIVRIRAWRHQVIGVSGSRVPAYLANYDMALARLACAGVDVWLNTPLPPLEASGTSGMKAAVNGVPSLSVLDGWWIEGHIEGVTGWAIGEPPGTASEGFARAADLDAHHAAALYDKLATSVLPCFYAGRERSLTSCGTPSP